MSEVQLEKAVTELSPEEFKKFRAWFANYDMAQWDKQIERDSAAGKLDRLMEEAMEDYNHGCQDDLRPHPGPLHPPACAALRRGSFLKSRRSEAETEGEGESFAAPLKIYTTGLAGRSFAKPEIIQSYFLSCPPSPLASARSRRSAAKTEGRG